MAPRQEVQELSSALEEASIEAEAKSLSLTSNHGWLSGVPVSLGSGRALGHVAAGLHLWVDGVLLCPKEEKTSHLGIGLNLGLSELCFQNPLWRM